MRTILHFIDEIKMGGAQTHLLTILTEMKKQHPEDQHLVAVLFEKAPLMKEFESLGIRVDCLEIRNFSEKKKFYSIYKLISQYIKKINPDVVESHLTWSRFYANTAAFINKVPRRIGFEHGDVYLNSITFRMVNFYTQFLFNKIVVCSEELKTWTKKTHRIKSSKLKVMTNCVDLKKFKSISNKNLADYLGLKKMPAFNFVSVGTLGKGVNKRVDISIRAFAKLKNQNLDVGLIICGDGDQKNDLKILAKDLGIEESVYFLGMRNDVNKILPHCDAFVHAAPFEPFGIVCIEAMACGLPAIVPNSGGIKDIVTNGEDGYIYSSLNSDDMAAKMFKMASEKNNYDKMKMAALRNVKKYGVDIYVNELYKLYNGQ